MNPIHTLADRAWVQLLGWSLVQFLWQGTVIAVAFVIARAALRDKVGAHSRYVMACAALALMVTTPIVTFLSRLTATPAVSWSTNSPEIWSAVLPWLVAAWFAGVGIGTVRVFAGWVLTARLRSVGVRVAPVDWQNRLQRLVHVVGVSRPVRLLVSSLVEVPAVIGWWKPVILVPVGALTGLPPEHIESLLAHELAHIRRFDFLALLIQSLAESVLFYHPAVWWVSNQVRAEREVCCDEIVVAVTGDAIGYARALTEFESCRVSRTQALAATGGSLLDRVLRLVGQTPPASHSLPGPSAAATMSLVCLVGLGASGKAMPIKSKTPEPSRPLLSTLLFGPVGPGIQPLPEVHRPDPVLQASSRATANLAKTLQPTSTPMMVLPILDRSPSVEDLSQVRLALPEPSAPQSPVPVSFSKDAPSIQTGAGDLDNPQQKPMFRAGVDVVEMDISVTDRDHRPVRGLTASDFTIFEDGARQNIVAFSAVELPEPMEPSAAWMRRISPDVESNDLAPDRLFAIVLDDALMSGMWRQQKMREVARAVINGLGPTDEAAVVFSGEGWNGQTFTSDTAKLLRAVDYVRPTMAEGRGCAPVWGSAGALRAAAEALSEVPHRRKILVYVSNGGAMTLFPGIKARSCDVKAQIDAEAAVRAAQRSNTNIYSIDPTGLQVRPVNPATAKLMPTVPFPTLDDFARGFLEDLATHTGGGTVYNTNEPASRVPQILEASRSYYLLGYQLMNRAATGLYHRVEVKLNRPGLDVHARTSRYDPKTAEADGRKPVSAAVKAISGYLPNANLRILVTAAPFRLASGGGRTALTLEVSGPPETPTRRTDTFDVVTEAFTVDGRPVASAHGVKQVAADKGAFQIGSTIDLKPGRYSLRIAVQDTTTGRMGSVYTDVVVPNFKDEALSLSGAVLTTSATALFGRAGAGAFVPVTSRVFAKTDPVQAGVRLYQGGSHADAPVEVTARIVDAHDAVVFTQRELVPAAVFAMDREADYWVRLPLSTLSAGEYWLSLNASIAKHHESRDVRFSVK